MREDRNVIDFLCLFVGNTNEDFKFLDVTGDRWDVVFDTTLIFYRMIINKNGNTMWSKKIEA